MLVNSEAFWLLRGIWRLSVLLVFPVIVIGYLDLTGLTFIEIDRGSGFIKLQIVLLYLAYLLGWAWINSRFFRHRISHH